jgi:hypothetical protein
VEPLLLENPSPTSKLNSFGYQKLIETIKEICEIKYDFVSDFESIFAIAELNSKYGIINNYGHEVCEFKYSENEIYDIFKKYIKKYIKNHNRNLKLNQLV